MRSAAGLDCCQHGPMAEDGNRLSHFEPLQKPQDWVLVGPDLDHAVPMNLLSRRALLIEDEEESRGVKAAMLALGRPLIGRLPGEPWLAFGIMSRLKLTAEGGRRTPIPRTRYTYRPDWGLPGMEGTEQVGAPVLWMGKEALVPGATARAVIVPLAPGSLNLWRLVKVGEELRMFEGARVCGTARVDWSEATERPLPPDDESRFVEWCELQDA